MSSQEFFVYLLRCSDQSLYTGYTTDLKRRLAAHNAGTGAKYTRSRRPVQLAYAWSLPDKRSALQLEYALKQMSRKEKEALLLDPPSGASLLAAWKAKKAEPKEGQA